MCVCVCVTRTTCEGSEGGGQENFASPPPPRPLSFGPFSEVESVILCMNVLAFEFQRTLARFNLQHHNFLASSPPSP